ncbi:MAG: hypothetical protein K2X46_14220 [Roseomonas sp.]|nr:hypothetical protein [Roseomonas sp.]
MEASVQRENETPASEYRRTAGGKPLSGIPPLTVSALRSLLADMPDDALVLVRWDGIRLADIVDVWDVVPESDGECFREALGDEANGRRKAVVIR